LEKAGNFSKSINTFIGANFDYQTRDTKESSARQTQPADGTGKGINSSVSVLALL
jgi:hypothetical protein